MKLQHVFVSAIALGLWLLAACDDQPIGPQGQTDGHTTGIEPVENPSLCDVSEKLLGACVTCHAAGAIPPELTESGLRASINVSSAIYAGETWIVPRDPDLSLIYKKISWSAEKLAAAGLGGVMPPSPPELDSSAVGIMRTWIEEGAFSDCEEISSDGSGQTDGATDAGIAFTSADGGAGN